MDNNIIVNTRKIKGRMVEKNVRLQDIADKIGINISTMSAKINDSSGRRLTLKDVSKMIEILEIDNPTEYFFYQKFCVNANNDDLKIS